jgi:micrococcal nuclease
MLNRYLASLIGFVTAITFYALPAKSQVLMGRVAEVIDGDTLKVAVEGKDLTVRLACIDAPELSQGSYGIRAAERLQQLLPWGQEVKLAITNTDRYGRTVAQVYRGSGFVNMQMVREGHAVAYRQYLDDCFFYRDQILASEFNAKSQQRGFWGQTLPVMPWDYRSNQKPSYQPQPNKPVDQVLVSRLRSQLQKATSAQDWSSAVRIIDQLIEAQPERSVELMIQRNQFHSYRNGGGTFNPSQSSTTSSYGSYGYPSSGSSASGSCQYSWQTDSLGRRCGGRAESERPGGRYTPSYRPSYTPSSSGTGSVRVRGYTRKDGTYVRPHYRRR